MRRAQLELSAAERGGFGLTCPHPEKVGFASAARARRHVKRIRGTGGPILRSYRCECGLYHLRSRKRDRVA